ncbi:MAG: DNA repair protein RadA [bacterium]|nr:MAG: DNA repair protein RadA [bacterium]
MARRTTAFICQECGAASPKWMGRCPDCGTWGSVIEELRTTSAAGKGRSTPQPLALAEVPDDSSHRLGTGYPELDRVLGGGMVPGSVILIGGDPGVGKSTLLLQVVAGLSREGRKALYVTAEESLKQIKARAQRVGSTSDGLMVLAETDFSGIKDVVTSVKPAALVLDSVQTLYHPEFSGSSGSIGQVRQIATEASALAKEQDVSVWLIGHVTKEGSLAGPRALEHLVDTVLYFEGENSYSHRILRAVKNRYGSTNEIALLEMTEQGLVEVSDPSRHFLPPLERPAPGSASVMVMEGTRPLLVEVQALASSTAFPNPRRTVSGSDLSRVLLILAVLDRRAGIPTASMDVFVNVAGGLRLTEPATDLGIAVALASSIREIPVRPKTGFCGELGLSGEIRMVPHMAGRLREAARMGLTRAIVPLVPGKKTPQVKGLETIPVKTLEDALNAAFG